LDFLSRFSLRFLSLKKLPSFFNDLAPLGVNAYGF
jgi:hypothetical protein